MIMRTAIALAGTLLLSAQYAHAEIETSPRLSCVALDTSAQGEMCRNVWPKLTFPAGWLQDTNYSNETGVNHLYYEPDPTHGSIYAGAEYAEGKARTVDGYMAADKAGFTGYTVTDGPVFTTADGRAFRSQVFVPDDKNDTFEIAVYGEEISGDGQRYYLTFVLTAPDQAQQDKYLPAFKASLAAYHR